jgi:spermidine/putrescine transport system substrate-binding protein
MPRELDSMVQPQFGRRDFLRFAGIAVGAGVLAACKKAATTTPTVSGAPATHPPIGEEPGNLQVFDWAGYGDGAYGDEVLWKDYKKQFPDDPPKFITFQEDPGFTKVAQGTTYDVVHPCGYKFPDYVDLGAMQPWDTSKISNFTDLNPALEKAGVIDGQQYFIVADWGFAAPMYRADKVTPKEDSWSLLWDTRYKNRIAWEDSLNMFIVAAYANGVADPWNMTADELSQMKQFLITQKKAVSPQLWLDQTDIDQKFKSEDVYVGYAWPASWVVGQGNGLDLAYMQPKEGRTSWYCGFGLFADTQNYHHAHEYVNAWTSPESGAWLLNNYGYGQTNTKIDLSKIDPATVKAFSLDDPTVLDEPTTHVERPIGDRGAYSAAWSEVKGA